MVCGLVGYAQGGVVPPHRSQVSVRAQLPRKLKLEGELGDTYYGGVSLYGDPPCRTFYLL